MQVIFVHITIFFVILSVKSFTMQANNSNINDMFSGTGSYPLENLSKENRGLSLPMHLTGSILKQNTTRDSRTRAVVRATSLPAWSLAR